jgi:hypothetical protein
MIWIAWRLSKGYRLSPWHSPYLRWRIETYWGLDADRITAREFFQFTWRQRHDLIRFLHWAEKMDKGEKPLPVVAIGRAKMNVR